MEAHTVKLSKDGPILIPAAVRAKLGLHGGTSLRLRIEGGEIRLASISQALLRAQNIAQKYKKPGEDVVDEFLKDRRIEAERT
jgi:AbrB family looped-hinge helix DNA binding protein